MRLILTLRKLVVIAATLLWVLAAPARAAELIMFETSGCGWCSQWHAEIGPGYPKTAEGIFAPLMRHQLSKPLPTGVVLLRPITSTPTFVLVDRGKEIGRVTGYPGSEFFYGLLEELLDRIPDWQRLSKSQI